MLLRLIMLILGASALFAPVVPVQADAADGKVVTSGADVKAVEDKKEVCTVCGATQDAPAAPVGATTNYKGKIYPFCSKDCRGEFLKTPQRFLQSDIGTAAPGFSLKSYQGKMVSLADFKGQVVLVDLWATFCPFCRKSLPGLQSYQTQFAAQGFTVLGVSFESSPAEVAKAAKAEGLTYPLLLGTNKIWDAYKVVRLPTLVLVGRDGQIIKRFGPLADKASMAIAIERALATPTPDKKPTP
jgi:peroxiredoxin